jgi:molybdenum cofactor synthesis domain-containing protein
LKTTTAASLLIGNEILSGKVEEANLSYLTHELWALGISLREVRILRDDVDAIVTAVRALSNQHTYVFTTGGIGPTHDDVTVEAVARAFAVPLVLDPTIERLIRASCPGVDLSPRQLRMALVPEGAQLVGGGERRWPTICKENVFLFPGIPKYFRRRFADLRERLRTTPFARRFLYTTMGEGEIADLLDVVVERFPGVEVGSYPVVDRDDYRVRISFEGRDAAVVEEAHAALRALLPPGVEVDL